MSEEINNKEYRKKAILEMLQDLHNGKDIEEVKIKFAKVFKNVSASEISEAEQALIAGGVKVEEIQRLCDVHAEAFKSSLETKELQSNDLEEYGYPSGHPINTLRKENQQLTKLLDEIEITIRQENLDILTLKKQLQILKGIHNHYLRKENLFFPYMERYGITAPPKVMWGIDDEIRYMIKQSLQLIDSNANVDSIVGKTKDAIHKIREMVFKEEKILIPMIEEQFTIEEWQLIADESDDLGYFLIDKPIKQKIGSSKSETKQHAISNGEIMLPTGSFKIEELISMLDGLPLDITFVDKDDIVKYFSNGTERFFPRNKAAIGRNVANCHPPASVHIVKGILDDFKSGKKTHEDFWIKIANNYIYIRYFALKDKNNNYIGTLEVTQNIKPIQEITGEKRLVE